MKSLEARFSWYDSDETPWEVSLRFATIEGKVVCVGFAIVAEGEPRPVTAQLVRSVPVGGLIRDALDEFPLEFSEIGDPPPLAMLVSIAEASIERNQPTSTGTPSKRGPGRPRKYGPEHYAEVARVYLESKSAPTSRVAKHFQVPKGRAANWVRAARDLGLIPELAETAGAEPGHTPRRIRTPKGIDPQILKQFRRSSDEQ